MITWLSLGKLIIPGGANIQGSDKVGHLLVYLFFTIFWFLFFFYSEKKRKSFVQSILLASILGVVYGMLMEIFQGVFTSYRTPDWNDIVANAIGVIIAVVILKLLKNKIVVLKHRE
ncbi:VanZ family protein [Aquimarina sp. RZ0]|uniref:VanZ family protein n=1 Tax=Aquimarina sp. RZ0 TaxID=2607730 RepID=UPI00165F121F|nr:VanZ family protein [Aquimarina sp. RZ0]